MNYSDVPHERINLELYCLSSAIGGIKLNYAIYIYWNLIFDWSRKLHFGLIILALVLVVLWDKAGYVTKIYPGISQTPAMS